MNSRASKKYITVIDLKSNKCTIVTTGVQARELIPGISYDKYNALIKNSNIAFWEGYIIAVSNDPPKKQNRKGAINNMAFMIKRKKEEEQKAMNALK